MLFIFKKFFHINRNFIYMFKVKVFELSEKLGYAKNTKQLVQDIWLN